MKRTWSLEQVKVDNWHCLSKEMILGAVFISL